MCEECHRVICPAACPNYEPKVYGSCYICNSNIFDGDFAYDIEGTLYCSDCIDGMRFEAEVDE